MQSAVTPTLRRVVRRVKRMAGITPPVTRAVLTIPPDYIAATGMAYTQFLPALHDRYLFDWYLEIGCRFGTSFAPVRGRTIAVDPFFQTRIDVIGSKPELHVFQMTSDDFFGTAFATSGVRLSFSFLDGMHLFEYLLRDFIATERISDPDGVIAMHDCCPMNPGMTTRDLTVLDALPGKMWTGDVWKLIPILQKYRPDLTLTVLDCASTGLVLVSGLSPGNPVLQDNYAAILAEFGDLDLEAYGAARFFGSFDFVDAERFLTNRTDFWDKAVLPSTEALQPRRVSI